MGYGKKGKKGKQALARQFEDLSSERNRYIAEIAIGAILVFLSLVVTGISGATGFVPEEFRSGVMIGGCVITFLGAVLAAIGCIKFSQVNPEYKRVKGRMGY